MIARQLMQEIMVTAFLSQKYPYFAELYAFHMETKVMIMKHYEGGSLTSWMKSCNWTKVTCLRILHDIALGINAMHSEDIAHCDLKPDNILIDVENGSYKAVIGDLGITKILKAASELPVREVDLIRIRGFSAFYASAETFQSFNSDTRTPQVIKASDIYSTGGIVFFSLCKRDPWKLEPLARQPF